MTPEIWPVVAVCPAAVKALNKISAALSSNVTSLFVMAVVLLRFIASFCFAPETLSHQLDHLRDCAIVRHTEVLFAAKEFFHQEIHHELQINGREGQRGIHPAPCA